MTVFVEVLWIGVLVFSVGGVRFGGACGIGV